MPQIQRPSGINVGILNPGTTVYIKGSETVDGSFRITLDEDETSIRIEERVAGVWVLTQLELNTSNWVVDDNLGEFVLDDNTGNLVLEG